ncbi:MAG: type II secretion system F family protein [Actinomycetes bacterium]
MSERTGASAAAVLDRLAEALRAEAEARGARTTAMAGPRATARVLAWLPVLGLALGQLVGADPLNVLLGTSLGRICAVTGALLALASALWTRRLVKLAEAPP